VALAAVAALAAPAHAAPAGAPAGATAATVDVRSESAPRADAQARQGSGPRLLWSRRIGTSGADAVFGVLVSQQGVYIHGTSIDIPSFKEGYSENEVFVQRWSLTGDLLWTHRIGEPDAISSVSQMSVATDGDVTLITAPGTVGEGYQSHAARVVRHLSGADGSEAWQRELAAAPIFGPVVVTDEAVFEASTWKGSRHGAPAFGGFDAVLTRFDLDSGEVEWVHQAGSPKRDGFESLVMGPDGDLYAGGTTSGAWRGGGGHVGGTDAVVTRIDPDDGSAVWVKQIGTARNDNLNVRAVDAQGVTITGMTFGSFAGSSAEQPGVAVRFSLGGKQQWLDQLPSPTSYVGDAEAAGGTVYTSGRTRNDIATVGRARGSSFLRAVGPRKAPRWTVQFGGDSEAYRLAVGQGRIAVAGETFDKRAFGGRQGPSDGYLTVWED